MEQKTPQEDRCVFKKDNLYYKVFLGKDKLIDYQREAFIGKLLTELHTNKDDHIMKTLETKYNVDQTTKDEMVATAKECAAKITSEKGPLPLVVTQDTGGEDLYEWLEKPAQQDRKIPPDVIKKFALQMVWLLGEMQSQFGIQHNDIQEMNIKVKEVTSTPKKLAYKLENDLFELELVTGDIEVILIDFGSAALKKQPDYDKNPKPWSHSYVSVLQVNNCPEAFFFARKIVTKKKAHLVYSGEARHSESDLFMLGHVLLSMYAHNRFSTFKYKKYMGVHVFDVKKNLNILDKWTESQLSTLTTIGPEDPLLKVIAPGMTKAKVIDMFFLHLIAINVELQGEAVGLKEPPYVTKNEGNNVQQLYQKMKSDATVLNYVKTHFKGLKSALDDVYTQSFISRLMDFDMKKRRGPNKYSLTGYLFHPYFAEFYKGYKNITPAIGFTTYTIKEMLPPLEYSSNKKAILQIIEEKEDEFNRDFTNQENAFKKSPAPAVVTPPPPAPAVVTPPPASPTPSAIVPSPPASPKPSVSLLPTSTSGITPQQETTLQDCITFINQLQNPQWAKDGKTYPTSQDDKELQIINNTNKCIDLAYELSEGDPAKLEALVVTQMVVKNSDGTYQKKVAGFKDGEFAYITVTVKRKLVFRWNNMAANGAYLAVGLYIARYGADAIDAKVFTKEIDNIPIETIDFSKEVEATRKLTQERLKEFWTEKKGTGGGGGTTVVPVLPAGPSESKEVKKPENPKPSPVPVPIPEGGKEKLKPTKPETIIAMLLTKQAALRKQFINLQNPGTTNELYDLTRTALNDAQNEIFKKDTVDMSDFDNIYYLRQKKLDNSYLYKDYEELGNKWEIQLMVATYYLLYDVVVKKLTNPTDSSIQDHKNLITTWLGRYKTNGDQEGASVTNSKTFKNVFNNTFMRDSLKIIDSIIPFIRSALEDIEHNPKTQDEINNDLYLPLKEYIGEIPELEYVRSHLGLDKNDFIEAASIHGTNMDGYNTTRYLHALSVLASACESDDINIIEVSKCFDMWPPKAPYQKGKVNEI